MGFDVAATRERLRHGPMSYPAFRRIMTARAISTMGTWMQNVAAGFLVYQLTGSAMLVGVLGFCALGPNLIGTPIGGALADRYCPRKLVIIFSSLEVLPPLMLGVAGLTGNLSVPLIFVGVIWLACVHSITSPIQQLIIPFAVPKELRHAAVADTSAAYSIGTLVGTAAGGIIVELIGGGWAFTVNAASNLIVALVFATSPVLQRACDLARASKGGNIFKGVRRGWQLQIVQTIMVGAVLFASFVAPLQMLMPKIAADHGESAMLLGFLLGVMGIGALVANGRVRRWAHDGPSGGRTLVMGVCICAAGTVLLGISPWLATDLLLLATIGFGWEVIYVSGSATVQLDVPEDIRGRMVGMFFTLATGATALGSLIMGALFQDLGVAQWLVITGAVALAGALLIRFRLRRGMRMIPVDGTIDG
jgi:MFS family permease